MSLKLIKMTIEEDSQPQDALGNKQKTKKRGKKKGVQQENSANKKPVTKNKQLRNANEKGKKAIAKKLTPTNQDKSEVFHCDEIAANKEASGLISELIKCYMNNSQLPKEELEIVNKILHDKTVSVFSDTLNKCVEKLFNKLMSTEYFKELLSKRVVKKDAVCQTDNSNGDSYS